MNYLAHAWLSFNRPGVLTGNMISDFVKGKARYEFPEEIQIGIQLHRDIDKFTDDHPANHAAKEIFRPAYRLYCGAIVDVVYDHLLAGDNNEFPTAKDLKTFTSFAYKSLDEHDQYLPQKFGYLLPFMKDQNWLYNYRFEKGLERSLQGLAHRAVYMHESATAFAISRENISLLRDCYNQFFPELKYFAAQQLRNLSDR